MLLLLLYDYRMVILLVTAFSLWSESSRDFEFQTNRSTFLGLP